VRLRTKILAWFFIVLVVVLGGALVNDGRWSAALVFVGGALLITLGILFSHQLRSRGERAREFMADDEAANDAVLRGDLDEARRRYERWRTSDVAPLATAAVHVVAGLDMRLGRMRDAIEILEQYARTQKTLLPHTTVQLATSYALLGEIDAAKGWIDKTPATAPRRYAMPVAQLAFARAVIDCRSNRCAEAARTLDDAWPEIERTLKAHQVRPYGILRAFARANGDVRDADVVEGELALARPAFAGEHAYLGTAWPEMQQFLTAHGLV
jgi:hypothetical protein